MSINKKKWPAKDLADFKKLIFTRQQSAKAELAESKKSEFSFFCSFLTVKSPKIEAITISLLLGVILILQVIIKSKIIRMVLRIMINGIGRMIMEMVYGMKVRAKYFMIMVLIIALIFGKLGI